MVDGHAPITIHGGPLQAINFDTPIPSAQVKTAVLFAGLQAQAKAQLLSAQAAAKKNQLEFERQQASDDIATVGATSFASIPFSAAESGARAAPRREEARRTSAQTVSI